jgi:hypothetical protein
MRCGPLGRPTGSKTRSHTDRLQTPNLVAENHHFRLNSASVPKTARQADYDRAQSVETKRLIS